MNPYLCRVVLRPRSVAESFDTTLLLIRRHARRYRDLTLVVVVPVMVAILGLWGLLGPETHGLVVAAAVLVSPLLQGPFTVLTGRLLFADDVTASQALNEVGSRIGTLLFAWFVQVMAVVVGLCTGVFWIVTLPVTAYVLETALLERVDTQATVARSSFLAWRNFSVALAATLGWVLLTGWSGFVVELTGQTLVGFVLQLGEPFGTLYGGFVTPFLLVGMLLAQPLVATFRLLLYVDIRTRVEGWDLQVALRAADLVSGEVV
ncbi:MAG: hypothetical protein AAF211_05175 [Myxococcota bacterium]